ncbi:caspase family protein [Candidatus Sulfurimonas baltica]|uniref:Caspase family protein n=1 Tax=Candidatus Sulfurimonas baltica TaxID=2740404 RepID=A0A7S7RMP6_9BACT|nr:caspase family protein [Candidatus Sulfurimonas baltica]QOY51704.1 caspase family protein [Candidatus Sulfurimonas baltica]
MKQKIKILLLFVLLQLPVQLFADYDFYNSDINNFIGRGAYLEDKVIVKKNRAGLRNQIIAYEKSKTQVEDNKTDGSLNQNKSSEVKNLLEKHNESMYFFDDTSESDSIALLLKETKQKKVSYKRYLIVIGAENYEYTDNIVYSQNTAQMFTDVAQKTLGISKSNTLELTSKNASMGRIQMKMKKLLRRVKHGDTVYFYYSGHGIPVVSQKNEPYILPIDVEPEFISEAPFFKLQNIYKTLADSKASKVVAFIDSCFSGATDGVSVIKGVAATRIKPKSVTFDTKKMVILTAGKDNQYSNMYEEKKYRLFSYFLMESMLKGRTSVKDIYSDVYIKVKDKSYEMGDMKLQEPTMSGNKAMEF